MIIAQGVGELIEDKALSLGAGKRSAGKPGWSGSTGLSGHCARVLCNFFGSPLILCLKYRLCLPAQPLCQGYCPAATLCHPTTPLLPEPLPRAMKSPSDPRAGERSRGKAALLAQGDT